MNVTCRLVARPWAWDCLVHRSEARYSRRRRTRVQTARTEISDTCNVCPDVSIRRGATEGDTGLILTRTRQWTRLAPVLFVFHALKPPHAAIHVQLYFVIHTLHTSSILCAHFCSWHVRDQSEWAHGGVSHAHRHKISHVQQ